MKEINFLPECCSTGPARRRKSHRWLALVATVALIGLMVHLAGVRRPRGAAAMPDSDSNLPAEPSAPASAPAPEPGQGRLEPDAGPDRTMDGHIRPWIHPFTVLPTGRVPIG